MLIAPKVQHIPGGNRFLTWALNHLLSRGDCAASAALAARDSANAGFVSRAAPKLEPRAHGFDKEYYELLDQLCTTAAAQATEVEDLFDTETSRVRRHEIIDEAEHTITFSYYCISADKTGLDFFDKLIAAAKRGVQVVGNVSWVTQEVGNRFVLEGASQESYDKLATKIAELEALGGLLTFHATPSHFIDNFAAGNHFKSLVVDSEVAVVGGRNLVVFEFDPAKPMLDQDMLLRGPIAAQIDREMLRILSRARLQGIGDPSFAKEQRFALLKAAIEERVAVAEAKVAATPPKPTDAKIWPIVWDPTYDPRHFGDQDNRITRAYAETIKRAREEIIITGNYFNPEGEIFKELLAAVGRGVKVKIVTWGEQHSTGMAELLYIRSTALYPAMHRAGIEVFETDMPQHSKMIMADGKVACWGSYNADPSAHEKLVEGAFFTNDPIIVLKLGWAARFIMSNCHKLTDRRQAELQARSRPWYKRLAAATLGRIL